jgi:hypothetical protein
MRCATETTIGLLAFQCKYFCVSGMSILAMGCWRYACRGLVKILLTEFLLVRGSRLARPQLRLLVSEGRREQVVLAAHS